jgi:hypothetical protein
MLSRKKVNGKAKYIGFVGYGTDSGLFGRSDKSFSVT